MRTASGSSTHRRRRARLPLPFPPAASRRFHGDVLLMNRGTGPPGGNATRRSPSSGGKSWSLGEEAARSAGRQMEKSIILLLWLQYVVKISKSFCHMPTNNKTTAVFIEWDEFPKAGNPEFYFLKYQLVNNFAEKNIKSILVNPQELSKSITLEENEDYHIILQSLKYGQILSEKSFKVRSFSTSNIKTVVTSTSVSFNWSVLSSNDISVSISLNNSSQIMPNNVTVNEWDNLKPRSLYTFKFEFKQLYLDFINILQRLDVQVETGSCSRGWLALRNSCYKISKERVPWNIAQRRCRLSLSSAHLVDIINEEEKKFIISLLRSKNQIIIWAGLNDLKKDGHLTWTDGSSFGLKKNETFSFPMLPKNETDCYILQENATGSNYFYTRFFCYVPLPYICKYKPPSLQENLLIHIKDVGTTEVVFGWHNRNVWNTLNKWLKLGYKIIIKYYLDYTEEQYFESISPNTTEKTITKLFPGHIYRFLLFAVNEWEARTMLSSVFIVETRPLSAQNVTVTLVTPTEVFLHWNPPDLMSFHHYLVTILDVENSTSEEVLVEKFSTSVKIGDLKSFHHYQIYLFSVGERGTLSCFERPISAVTGINPPQKVHIKPEDVGEDSIILQWESPPDGQEVYIQIKPSSDIREVLKLFVRNANRLKIDHLTPGMTYDIGMATVMNGNLSELVTIQQTLSLESPSDIHKGKVTDSSIEILWNRVDGNFQHYEITCLNCTAALMVQKVVQEAATFSHLDPTTVYAFSIHPERGGFKDSPPNVKEIQTAPSAVEFMNHSRNSNAITVSWPSARSLLDGYIISISSECLMKEEILPSTERTFTFNSLSSGTDFLISIVTTKGLKRSHPTVLMISTCKFILYLIDFSWEKK
ncbi:uncharacterized protein LOC131839212 [Mustela lutreola]|uniref:uncharacterized protein LOC131839212 n=1 Tax=Mustela lutreola TaxID=9666 RepID=UPI002797A3D1|nr:uncharacterized protein LOC131839212 [Mustela lutreola]